MTKLEDRIRSSLHATAQQLPDTAEGFTGTAEPQSPPRVRGPVVAVAVMIGVLVVLGGSLFWFSNLGEPSPGDVADSVAAIQLERFPIPGYVPPSAELVYGDYAVPDPTNPSSVDAVVARTTPEGFTDGVVVTVYDASQVGIGVPEGEPVVINGHQATLFRNKGRVTLWWQQDDHVVTVRSPAGDATLAESVASVVTIANTEPFDETVLTFGSLPDGLAVFAPPRLAPPEPHPYVQIHASMGPETVDPEFVTIAVVRDTIAQVAGAFGSATATEIRGVDGYQVETADGVSFVWSHDPGVTVTVGGTYPEADIRAVAEGLDFVTEADWRRQYDSTGPQLPTTTTTHAIPITEPPAVGTDGDDPGAPTTTVP